SHLRIDMLEENTAFISEKTRVARRRQSVRATVLGLSRPKPNCALAADIGHDCRLRWSGYQALNEIRAQYFKNDPPASAEVVVKELVRPDLLVEVEAVAEVRTAPARGTRSARRPAPKVATRRRDIISPPTISRRPRDSSHHR